MSDILQGNTSLTSMSQHLLDFANEAAGTGRTIAVTPDQAKALAFSLIFDYIVEEYSPNAGGFWFITGGYVTEAYSMRMATANPDATRRIKAHGGMVLHVFNKHLLPEWVNPIAE